MSPRLAVANTETGGLHMRYIDMENWDRKVLFNAYLGTDFPYINMGANIDVTQLYTFAKEKQLSFYFAMVFVANEVANGIKNFKYRFVDEKPFLIDYNHPTITHMQPGNELFVMFEADFYDNIIDFCHNASKKAEGKIINHGLDCVKGRMDIINYSCIPWVQYTHFVRTISKDGIDCNPKISWGKFIKSGEQVLLPFSVQVHHGLMDGYHVGKYFLELQSYLAQQRWVS
ncbi:MAG: chloramphenicol acetyltransferase [Firmicutes bacterium]|nr:chloramphenicol acetyltransferase [Bacillota bacterium]